jgi:erythronate-4-phosphate dehydrogenase
MKIIADENIIYAKEAFGMLGEVSLSHGRTISNEMLVDTDALIVRSITKVDEKLLKNTNVKFVGTATIGTDHIDKEYLKRNNIFFADAAGCNSHAVKEYVFAAIIKLLRKREKPFEEITLGVIGTGNIGSKVAALAETLGIKVLKNDPPLARKTGSDKFVHLKDIFDADIITLHVPLNMEGEDKTYHLLDSANLLKIKQGAIIINTSRGEVIDNKALNEMIERKKLDVILDVWEDEPYINSELFNKVRYGTPHIAGYSFEGKVNGTKMMFDALARYSGKNVSWEFSGDNNQGIIDISGEENMAAILDEAISHAYSIENDHNEMKKMTGMDRKNAGMFFDLLRKKYGLRKEFNNYKVRLKNSDKKIIKILQDFRFEAE